MQHPAQPNPWHPGARRTLMSPEREERAQAWQDFTTHGRAAADAQWAATAPSPVAQWVAEGYDEPRTFADGRPLDTYGASRQERAYMVARIGYRAARAAVERGPR